MKMRLQVPHWLPPHGLVWVCVKSLANCLAFTSFLLRDEPVFLTNLKIGFSEVEERELELTLDVGDSEKLLVLLRTDSALFTASTRSWSLPYVDTTQTGGSGEVGTNILVFELVWGVRRRSKPFTFHRYFQPTFWGSLTGRSMS